MIVPTINTEMKRCDRTHTQRHKERQKSDKFPPQNTSYLGMEDRLANQVPLCVFVILRNKKKKHKEEFPLTLKKKKKKGKKKNLKKKKKKKKKKKTSQNQINKKMSWAQVRRTTYIRSSSFIQFSVPFLFQLVDGSSLVFNPWREME